MYGIYIFPVYSKPHLGYQAFIITHRIYWVHVISGVVKRVQNYSVENLITHRNNNRKVLRILFIQFVSNFSIYKYALLQNALNLS